MDLSRIDDERFTVLDSVAVTLDTSKDYNFVLQTAGSGLRGTVFELESGLLVADVGALDNTYAAGISGLYVFSNVPNGAADATFDQYAAGVVPEPSTIGLMVAAAALLLGSKAWRSGLCHPHETQS